MSGGKKKTVQISTNVGNANVLKPLVAANLANVKVDLHTVTVPLEGKQRPRLPLLCAQEMNTRLFDTNAMIGYIMELGEKPQPSHSLLNTMNMDTQTLSPLVLSYLSDKGDGGESGVGRELLALLETLQTRLVSHPFFSGPTASYEDGILWSTLYPLLASKDKLAEKTGALLLWFNKLNDLTPFSDASKLVEPIIGKDGAKVIIQCNPTASTSLFSERFAKLNLNNNVDGAEGENGAAVDVSADDIQSARDFWAKPVPLTSVKPKRTGQVLPIAGQKNYFITSALPYVNNVPHLGNIIGCVLSADVFARYCRVRGRNTLYICGTDEYGTATETKALEEKLTPQQICDKYHKLHKEIYDWFDISFDYFGRTTTKEQTEVGQDIFLKLNGNGYLKEMIVQQLFCEPCKRFLSDRFVEGTCPIPTCGYEDARGDQCDKCGRLTNSTELKNPRCKVCGSREVTTKNSDQIFLDLPKLEAEAGLAGWLDKASEGWTPNARHIAKSWMREGLKERCITRDLKWGTPVPLQQYKEKVFYVWFDAPIGYISMTKCYTDNWQLWWRNSNPDVSIDYYQFMAKDNVPFHSILFPASLKGTREPWTLVKHLIATEYLNYEEGKFSKSRGVGVFGNDAIQTGIPADIWRFYLIYMRPENQDSAFSWDDFMTKNNSELLNNLGNFVNRSLQFLSKFFESKIPTMNLTEDDFRIVAEVNKEIAEFVNQLELCKLREGLRRILAISKIGNGYFQAQQPWTLNKNETDRERCGTICGMGAQMVFLLMTLMEPFMPGVSRQIREQLNVSKPIFSMNLLPFLPPGHQIGKVGPLFQKLEVSLIDELRKRYAGQQQPVQLKSPSKTKVDENNSDNNKVVEGKGVDATPSTTTASSEELAKIEADIAKQANIVRDLKTAKADKSAIQPQIEKLLALKSEFTAKGGVVAPPPQSSKSKGKSSKKK